MGIRIVLVDDHTLFRVGLEGLLTSRGIDVVASLRDGQNCVKVIKELQPDIVLLDMRMPGTDGLGVLKLIRQQGIASAVVMLTTSSDSDDLIDSLKAGAQGYLLKDMDPEELVTALKDIVLGKTVVAPDLAQVLARAVQGKPPHPQYPEKESPFAHLTPREAEILALLAEGQSNKGIARSLGISDGTVKLHVKAILRKLGVHSRVEAAVMAVEKGISKNTR